MRLRLPRVCIWIALAVAAQAQQRTPSVPNPPRIQMSESEMESRLIVGGEINYPAVSRATHTEGQVVLDAIIGTDGSVLSLQAVKGDPYLIRAALEGVSKWRYRPVAQNGTPVEVATSISVRFKLTESPQLTGPTSARSGPLTAQDTQAGSPETIYLTNGRTIHADAVIDDGQKIEYTLGDSVYEIPKSLVKSIEHARASPPLAGSSTTFQTAETETATVTGVPLKAIPTRFGDDPKNWYPYESTEQLRRECTSGDFYDRFHPELQTADFFPNKDDAQRICAVINIQTDGEYEVLVDRGVELQHSLCPVVNGRLSKVHSSDPNILAMQQEMGHISAEFMKRMNEFAQNPSSARGPGLRFLLDIHRLDSECGHGY